MAAPLGLYTFIRREMGFFGTLLAHILVLSGHPLEAY